MPLLCSFSTLSSAFFYLLVVHSAIISSSYVYISPSLPAPSLVILLSECAVMVHREGLGCCPPNKRRITDLRTKRPDRGEKNHVCVWKIKINTEKDYMKSSSNLNKMRMSEQTYWVQTENSCNWTYVWKHQGFLIKQMQNEQVKRYTPCTHTHTPTHKWRV